MVLEKITGPQDCKKLAPEELTRLCAEIRERMIAVVSRTGGHLASSLGAVELVVALHYCLNCPRDKIVFDVGHQAYAHKILTGRNAAFDTLRQFNGLSGFPLKDESAFDPVSSGHSSDAVSTALGLVCAGDYLPAGKRFRVAAVIGDGSLSGGLCFEGLNNAGHLKKDLLVVLNTNELSIAPNVGAISTYLNKIISLPIYNRFRDSFENFLGSRVRGGRRLLKLANKFEEGLKGLFIPGILFEELGFRYFGPFDGHNLATLIPALKNIIEIKGPRIVHVVTRKGKGYAPAERDPVRFHSVGKFNVADGTPVVCAAGQSRTYTQVFSDALVELAKANDKIIAITAAMPEGTGLDAFRDAYPERFFDVGIAEQHAVCFAGALASQGYRPVVAIYSTFLQRAFDQIIEEVCLQDVPVVFAIDRAGLVGEDGVTHQGLFDIGFLRSLPNLVVMAPKDEQELRAMLRLALTLDKPSAIRYPKAAVPASRTQAAAEIAAGKAAVLREGKDAAIIALGSMVGCAVEAAELLQKDRISAAVVNARFVKPLDEELLRKVTNDVKMVFSVEEGISDAGFGSALQETLQRPVRQIGLPCQFIAHGRRDILLEKYGLTAAGIASRVKKELLHGKNHR
ncbi:MAG: 1-deoxy-D-xylulose-5-phosphate synthase [Candidatus Omnitrophica bacterium]|nr:1-deoxy-D-xylulose-5-phosphate synthase [Candidatus Omnitrophota bacterium]